MANVLKKFEGGISKIILSLLLFFILSCSEKRTNLNEVAPRIEKIVMKLRNTTPLPDPFEKTIYASGDTMKSILYMYDTGRNEGSKRDTVEMVIEVFKKGDSFDRIYFNEKHRKEFHGDYGMEYMYGLNNKGDIIKAYSQNASTEGYKVISWRKDASPKGDSIPDKIELAHPKIIEINLSPDSNDTFNSVDSVKNADEKTLEKYRSKLNVTLDELEKIFGMK